MNITEINDFRWEVSDKLKVVKIKLKNLEAVEQECHIWIMKQSYDDANKPETRIQSSYQKWISKLSNSQRFELKEVLISDGCGNDGFILQVKGNIDNSGITVRQTRQLKLTDKQIEKRLKNMKKGQ